MCAGTSLFEQQQRQGSGKWARNGDDAKGEE